jgi:hypothetical protein
VCSFSLVVFFSLAIAATKATKATMAMVGHFHSNPEKEIQGNIL